MKHKVKTILFIGLALVALFGMTACPNNAGGGGNIPVPAAEKYAVAFNADGGNGGALTAKVDGNEIHSGDKVEKGKLVEFTAQPADGKRADTWFIGGGDFEAGSGTAGSDAARVRVSGNISVRVSFKDAEAGKHIVRFGIEGSAGESRLSAAVAGGTAILSGNEVSNGSIVEFRAAPESGKTVDRWTVEGGSFEAGSGTAGSDTARVKVSGNISVRVSFKDADPNKRIVTFGVEGSAGESAVTAAVSGGTAILSGNEVSDGAAVEFTAVPAPGYKVKLWTIVKTDDSSPLAFEEGGTEGTLSAKAKAVSNLTVKVEFERIVYTVAFGFEGSSEQGSFTAQKDGVDFASGGNAFYGEELTFSAKAKAGWKITSWTIVKTDDNSPLTFEEGGTEGSLTAKAKVTCNLTVKVKFEKIICTVAFTVPGGHGTLKAKAEGAPVVSVSPIQVEYGKTVEFTADPAEGYKVKAWTVNGNTVTADSTYSLFVVRDVNLTVTFTEDNVRITISGDERVNEGGYIDIPKGKTWKEIKTQIEPKFALKGEWQGGDYGAYQWKLNNGNGNIINDDYTFNEAATVYAVTNYLKFKMQGTKLTGYDGAKPRGRIIINDIVTEIGWWAFSYCKDLQSVDFFACTALTQIGESAFSGCERLTGELHLPASLTEIGKSAFSDCRGLTKLDLSACTILTQIGASTFSGCWNLSGELQLPASLTQIGERAFSNCERLTGELHLPASLTQIGASAFSGCSGLTKLDLSACIALMKISRSTFNYCKGLTEVELPANLTQIDVAAFSDCSNAIIKLPESIIQIGPQAFGAITTIWDRRCEEVKIKGGSEYSRIKALVIASGYTADRIGIYW